MERAKSFKREPSFNYLPNEILLMIFDYLSSNDILHTFFFLTERFNNLLLQNQRYFNYLKLRTTDFATWEIILSIIGPKIQCLNITITHLFFPLRYFPNLKTLRISSLYGLSEVRLTYIIESDLFENLSLLIIKQEKIFSNPYLPDNVICEEKILKNVFNENNSLKTFEYSLMISSSVIYSDTKIFQINFNLHSLTLALDSFLSIFVIIQYTPILKYLNVKTRIPFANGHPIEKTNVKLKELHLILNQLNDYVDIRQVIDGIKQFSSSLVCLSLDLVDYSIRGINQFPFDSLQLPQFLKSMKQFYLYTKEPSFQYHSPIDFSQFKDQYSSFGMHADYIYTLPFHFNNIYDCFQDFSEIRSNNCEILKNNSRIWSKVKSIQLPVGCGYDRNFLKELKMKMPKLTLIKFDTYGILPKVLTDDSSSENTDVTLDNVKTIQFMRGSIENKIDWIIHSLPNLKHLILSYTEILSKDSQLTRILNEKIRRLDIDAYCQIEQLTERSFSNVENMKFYLNDSNQSPEWYAEMVLKILNNFPNLKIMMIRNANHCHLDGELSFAEKNLIKTLEYFNMNDMHKIYQVESMKEYTLFYKISLQI